MMDAFGFKKGTQAREPIYGFEGRALKCETDRDSDRVYVKHRNPQCGVRPRPPAEEPSSSHARPPLQLNNSRAAVDTKHGGGAARHSFYNPESHHDRDRATATDQPCFASPRVPVLHSENQRRFLLKVAFLVDSLVILEVWAAIQ